MSNEWQWIWHRIAHEQVELRIKKLLSEIRASFPTDEALTAFHCCTDSIPPIALEKVLVEIGDKYVSRTYAHYCDVWAEQGNKKTEDFVLAVWQKGLIPFIRQRLPRLLCLALMEAMPKLKNDTPQGSVSLEDLRGNPERWPKVKCLRRAVDEVEGRCNGKIYVEREECQPSAEGPAASPIQVEMSEPSPATTDPIPGERVGQPEDRRAQIDAFIAKLVVVGRKITRKDIWTAAGYRDRTEFERFQRRDHRTTASGTAAFKRVLAMSTDDFIRLLETKTAQK